MPAPPSTSGRGRTALVVLMAGYAAIALIGSTPTSPIRPPLPSGVEPPGWAASAGRWIGLERLSAGWLVAVTMIVLGLVVVAFVVVVAESLGGRVRATTVAASAALSIGIAVAGPVVLSRDVSSYAAYGRIAAVYGGNPYVETPADHPSDAFTPVVSTDWVRSRSVYGPVFTSIGAAAAAITRRSPATTILAFKVLAGGAVALAVWFAAATARRRDPGLVPLAIILVGVNPVIVVHTVGGGHNDALVCLGLAAAAFIASGLGQGSTTEGFGWAAIDRRTVGVTAVLTVTALVKIVAVIPLVMFVVASVALAATARRRVRVATAHLAVVALLGGGVTAVYGSPAIRALADLASRTGWASAERLVRRGVDAAGGLTAPALRTVVAVVFAAALLVVLWPLVRRPAPGDPGDPSARWGTALLGAALAGPYLLPWYAAWFAPLIGAVRDRVVLWIGVATCGVLALTGVPAEPGARPGAYQDGLLWVHYVAAPSVLVLLAALVVRSLGSLGGRAAARHRDPAPAVATGGTR